MISNTIRKACSISLLVAGLLGPNSAFSQVQANAGNDVTVCINQTYIIGGSPTASGGTPPFTYSWSPFAGLNNFSIANPTLTPNINTTQYVVTVTDALGNSDKDTMLVFFHPVSFASAANDTSVCFGDTAFLGKPSNPTGGGISYSWQPVVGVNNPSSPNPITNINTTTTYTVTISSSTCPDRYDSIRVNINQLPTVSAGPDVTINEGDVATLQGSGATTYWWSPNNTLMYFNTANPDAAPLTTTTYLLIGLDDNGCANYDWVTVFVIPGKELIFYNTFTPNNDGENDVWIIANVEQYPGNKLHIYNRYGQLVFAATPYLNTWNGKNLGEDVADGTYYYTFDPGDGSGIIYGSLTIIR